MRVNQEKLRGFVWKFGDNIDTDQIIPSRYCNTFRPESLGPHAMEGAMPDFAKQAANGDIIVAGRNFGCGSSREMAPIAIKAAGISAVVAHSFARIFYRNAVNIGLLVLISPAASAGLVQGEDILIEPTADILHSLSSGRVYKCEAPDGLLKEILNEGGLVGFVKHQLEKKNSSAG
mgnify:CR=1 FL=1